jgi:hypothetical protein
MHQGRDGSTAHPRSPPVRVLLWIDAHMILRRRVHATVVQHWTVLLLLLLLLLLHVAGGWAMRGDGRLVWNTQVLRAWRIWRLLRPRVQVGGLGGHVHEAHGGDRGVCRVGGGRVHRAEGVATGLGRHLHSRGPRISQSVCNYLVRA